MLVKPRGSAKQERIAGGVRPRPSLDDGRQECFPIGARRQRTGVGGVLRVLASGAKDVVDQRGRRVEQRSVRNTERVEMTADAFEYPPHCRLPRRPRKLGARPGMRVDRIEQPQRNCPNRLPWFRFLNRLAHDTVDDLLGRRGEQFVLVLDVPVDRPASRRQACRERTESQPALAA